MDTCTSLGRLKNISKEPKNNIVIFVTFLDARGMPIGNASARNRLQEILIVDIPRHLKSYF